MLTVGCIFLNVMVGVAVLVRPLYVIHYSPAMLPEGSLLCLLLANITVKAVMSYTFLLVEFVTFNMLAKLYNHFT